MGWLKIQKLKYLENETQFFYKIKKIPNLHQMTHFEKLPSFSGGNL